MVRIFIASSLGGNRQNYLIQPGISTDGCTGRINTIIRYIDYIVARVTGIVKRGIMVV